MQASTQQGNAAATPRQAGFTLIELMITVAIVGILAAVAYPSYRFAILKTNRAEGRAALLGLMQQQERWLTARGRYEAVNPTDLTALVFKNYSGESRNHSAYQLGAEACPVTPALGFTECVVVYAIPNFTDPEVGNLRIWSTGKRDCYGTTAPTRPDLCWR